MDVDPARGQLNRVDGIFPCPRSRLRISSRETSLRISPLILHAQAESSSSLNYLRWTPILPLAFRDYDNKGVHREISFGSFGEFGIKYLGGSSTCSLESFSKIFTHLDLKDSPPNWGMLRRSRCVLIFL